MDKKRVVAIFAAIWLVLAGKLPAKTLLVLEGGKDKMALEEQNKRLHAFLDREKDLNRLIKTMKTEIRIRKAGEEHLLTIGPMESNERMALLYIRLKKLFPAAAAVEIADGGKNRGEISQGFFSGRLKDMAEKNGELSLWIALFALAITGILALFVSSLKIRRISKQYERIRARHETIEKRFNELFSRLGENIHRLSKDMVDYTSNVIQEVEEGSLEDKLKQMVKTETQILDATANLLDFLRLKSKKISIKKNLFDLNSVLDDVNESLLCRMENVKAELIFDIDGNLPKNIIGDFVHIGEVLSNLLGNALEQSGETDVKLEVLAYRPYSGSMELQFKISYFPVSGEENGEEYFIPLYDEKSGEYQRLGCFVSYELTQLMGGEISVSQTSGKRQTIVDLTIPVEEPDKQDARKYRLNSRDYIQKEVLIVNRSYNASLALKKMFAYFRHHVKIMDANRFERKRPSLEKFDIVVIDETLINSMFVDYVADLKQQHNIKVVGLRNLFSEDGLSVDGGVFDARLTKPLNMKRVYTMINGIYGIEETEEEVGKADQIGESHETSQRQFWDEIPETPDISLDHFRDFGGSSLMVVEDNEINMKMLLKVLEQSGINIVTARNGQEAVEKMERAGSREIQLVLMDINMPVMDGFTATEKIRKMPLWKELPIVSLSALSLESELERMKAAGMDGYLEKPLNLGKLYSLFARYLKSGESPDAAEIKNSHDLAKLKGIDISEALKHTNNNEILLQEVLEEFLEGYGESDRVARKLYEEHRYDELKQLLLDLLGLSGTIGAKDIYNTVKEMYKLYVYNKLDLMPNYLIEYGVGLARIRDSLTDYLGMSGESGEKMFQTPRTKPEAGGKDV